MPLARPCLACLAFALLVGCGQSQRDGPPTSGTATAFADSKSDLDAVRGADVSILFVGNSHTMHHNVPELVGKMIRFLHPDRKVVTQAVGAAFLEDAAANP